MEVDDVEKITEILKEYFIKYNARMSKNDAVTKFAGHDKQKVKKAFDSLVNSNFLQSTGYVKDHGSMVIQAYGHSNDGTELPKYGYWVRTPLKIQKECFARIPVQMFKGFLTSQIKRANVIKDMINFATYDRYIYCNNELETEKFLGYEFEHNTQEEEKQAVMRFANKGKEVSMNIKTRAYFYCRVSGGEGDGITLYKIRDNVNFSNEQATIYVMWLALGSIQGNRSFAKTTNSFLLSRMDGNDSLVNKEGLSNEIRNISTRRKLQRLKELVKQYYHVSFAAPPGCKGFYFSTKLTEKGLIKAILVSIQKREGTRPKQEREEPTMREKFAIASKELGFTTFEQDNKTEEHNSDYVPF